MDDQGQAKLAQRVGQFKAIEARLKEMDEELAKRKEPLLKIKALLEGYFEQMLTQTGAQNFATPQGTVHWTHRVTASLEDADTFMKFVVEQKLFDLVERRAASVAVQEYCKEHNISPTDIGVKINSIRKIGVRAPTAKQKAQAV